MTNISLLCIIFLVSFFAKAMTLNDTVLMSCWVKRKDVLVGGKARMAATRMPAIEGKFRPVITNWGWREIETNKGIPF